MFKSLKAVFVCVTCTLLVVSPVLSNFEPRTGTVIIVVAGYAFSVPRILLGSVIPVSGKNDDLWRKAEEVDAQSFQISAYKTNLGTSGYVKWARQQGLPTQIRITRADDRFRSTFVQLEQIKSKYAQAQIHDGFERTETPSTFYYKPVDVRGRSFDDEPIVFACSRSANLTGGHTCRTAYRYRRELTIFYSFDDSNIPASEWLHLNERVREFIGSLMSNRT